MLHTVVSCQILSRKHDKRKLTPKTPQIFIATLTHSAQNASGLRNSPLLSTHGRDSSSLRRAISIAQALFPTRKSKNVKSGLRQFWSSSIVRSETTPPVPEKDKSAAKTHEEDVESPEPLNLNAEQPTPPPSMPLWKKYLSLAKFRLASLVVVTSMGGYLIAPGPIDLWDFTISTVGTALAIASANSINQYIEVDNDLMMKRTRTRMLPSGAMSLNHALAFGVITGVVGSAILGFGINILSASLAFANILLYTLVYTPLKRVTPINTWIGAIVGAIPPLIGWASKTGGLEPGAWVLFAALLLWQIPHFLALSWPLRYDYRNAGYKMLSVTSPDQVAPQTLIYSILMLSLGPAAWYTGLTSHFFIWDSTLLNLWLIYESWKFYKDNSNTSARRTFKVTLYWLPLFIILMMIHLNYWDSDADDEKEAAQIDESVLLSAPLAPEAELSTSLPQQK